MVQIIMCQIDTDRISTRAPEKAAGTRFICRWPVCIKNSIISVSCGSHSCFCVVTLSLSPVTSPCLSGLPELCLHHCLFSLFVPSTLYSLFSITTYLDQLARASWTDQFSIAIKCHLMLVVIVTVM